MDNLNGVHGEEEIPPMPTPMTANSLAASTSPTLRDSDKDDAQTQVITSLRAQITDLITQVSQLNGKLVGSYDRVSDLEDALHVASSSARATSLKIAGLEIERSQHLAALDTGLYVEKAHVTAELTRLMERATAEAAARGQAESARHNIEHELDDLSASLFGQANTMVAEARLERAMSERKVVDAELALRSAEEAVGMMQVQMQALRDEKDRAVDEISRIRTRMEKGKFVEHGQGPTLSVKMRLLSAHAPYQEYLQFIVHLRSIRHSTPNPPHISTLLPLPFLTRIQTEDSDPTVRLDFAPSLNWLSRRSVLSAIHGGQLTIEPISLSTLLSESSSSSFSSSSLQSMIAGSQPGISCALCGAHIFPPKSTDTNGAQQSTNPLAAFALARGASPTTWSTSLFKSAAPSPPPTPPPHNSSAQASPTRANARDATIYVFRVAPAPNQPHQQTHYHTQSQGHNQAQTQRPTSYPLCGNGWCLARLRTTCSLWAFVRAGVVDRVWEEEQPHPPATLQTPGAPPSISSASAYSLISSGTANDSVPNLSTPQKEKDGAPPPLPPRRRSKMSTSVGALWGMASGALRGSGTGTSQPGSPVRTEEKEAAPKIEPGPARKAAPEPLSVTVPPPVPRRSLSRRVTDSGEGTGTEEERPVPPLPGADSQNGGTGTGSPTGVTTPATSSTSEKTPIARSGAASPTLPPASPPPPADASSARFDAGKIAVSSSQGSSASAPSVGGEEFTTPVEEIGSLALPLAFSTPGEYDEITLPPRPTTPHSPPRSPRSPARSPARASFSPPRSPPPGVRAQQRMSSPPPPRSPRATPLPDSRPGTPGTPHRTARARPFSGSVSIAPLNLNRDGESGSRPPSRAASPAPVGAPPPVPRRAAARRAVPPPPGGAPPASAGSGSGSGEEKEPSPHAEKPSEALSEGAGTHPHAPPALPPRRPEHTVQESVSDHSDGGGGEARMEETQARSRASDEKASGEKKVAEAEAEAEEDAEAAKNFVGDMTWEERSWKEIVRLREDMFWARVGGLRG